jgi:DNA primase
VVTLANMLWFCAGCNVGGSPLQYLHRLRGGNGSPRGQDFVNLLRELCQLADVPFPERHLTPEQQERHRRLETRRAILESVYALCRQGLRSDKDLPVQARAYLTSRGFTDEHQESLELGLYPPIDQLRATLGQLGHAGYDVEHADVLSDQMAGYVTFPWRDDRGRSAACSAVVARHGRSRRAVQTSSQPRSASIRIRTRLPWRWRAWCRVNVARV